MRPFRAALAAAVSLAAAGVVAFGVVTPARGGAASPGDARANDVRANVVLVLTDDMSTRDLRWMPITRRLIGDRGVSFDAHYVNDPSCCPSRVTMLTGKYAHNTGVFTNGGLNGGFETTHQRGLESDTVATRLQAAGYRTGLFGKYLNGYPNGVPENWVPPGWTRWVSPVSGDPYSSYGYDVNVDGAIVEHGNDSDDYGTTVFARAAREFVRTSAERGKPFFAALTVYAPHLPAVAAPQDEDRFSHVRAPRTPSFNQRDVSASPSFIRELPRLGPRTVQAIDSMYRDRIQSLQAVDREIARLVRTAARAGVLDDTYFVFTSDNGFHLGQHRLPAGKYTPYETDIRVPMLVRGPGIPAGEHITALTGNVDLAPTFEAMAGVQPAPSNDGLSLLALAQRPSATATWTRNAYLIEHRKQVGTAKVQRDPSLPVEPSDPDAVVRDPVAPDPDRDGSKPSARERMHRGLDARLLRRSRGIQDYDAVRTARWLYVEYADGQRELYDVRNDPDQLVNLAGRDRVSVEATLHRRLEQLRTCAGPTCRTPVRATTS